TLLSLYFGPDDSGKNQEVVTRIESILKNYETLPLDGERISNKIKTKKEHLEERKKYWLEKAPKTTNGNPDKRTTEYTLFEDYERQLNTFNSECNDIIDSSVEQLDAFNVIIRTYLKEEWNRAKNNED
ncbi:MAG: hypothetical protein GXY08_06595, partial [Ruminococcus sp.]|nr:hypothetical protein [Ruminococcus sp.]